MITVILNNKLSKNRLEFLKSYDQWYMQVICEIKIKRESQLNGGYSQNFNLHEMKDKIWNW